MFKALSDSADGVSTGGSGASSSSGPVKVGGCPHIGGKAEGSSGLNMRRNVQCPMHVCSDEKRHLWLYDHCIWSDDLVNQVHHSKDLRLWVSLPSKTRKCWTQGRLALSSNELLIHSATAFLCFPGWTVATSHYGTRPKWLTVPKSRLPLMSMKTSAGNANSKQEHTVQILSLHQVPECSLMGCVWLYDLVYVSIFWDQQVCFFPSLYCLYLSGWMVGGDTGGEDETLKHIEVVCFTKSIQVLSHPGLRKSSRFKRPCQSLKTRDMSARHWYDHICTGPSWPWQSLTKLDKAWQRTGPPICQSRRHQSSGAKSSCIDHIRWYPVVAVLYSCIQFCLLHMFAYFRSSSSQWHANLANSMIFNSM